MTNQTLINQITAVVKTNGVQAITGKNMQSVLLAMVTVLGRYPGFAGIATPTTTAEGDSNIYYLAHEVGTYTNLGGVEITADSYHIIRRIDGSWSAIDTGIATEATITSAIASALSDYAKTTDVIQAIDTALQPYATQEQLNSAITLAREWVNSTLQSYATTEAVNQALQPYAKTEDVEQAIEESKTDLTDVELVAAAALNDLNERVNALLGSDELVTIIDGKIENLRISLTDIIDTLRKAVIDNELVTAAALNDLNSRI